MVGPRPWWWPSPGRPGRGLPEAALVPGMRRPDRPRPAARAAGSPGRDRWAAPAGPGGTARDGGMWSYRGWSRARAPPFGDRPDDGPCTRTVRSGTHVQILSQADP